MRTERRITVHQGNDGQLIYGLETSIYFKKDNRTRLKSLHYFFYSYIVPLLAVLYIAATIVVLVLSKHEKPHTPLRAWILGIVSGSVAALALLTWYFMFNKCFSDILSTYDIEMVLDGKTPVTGCKLHALRSCTRAETPLEWFRYAFTMFRWIWVVIGCVWIWKESSLRSDAPRLYWLCMSLAISSGFECAMQLFISAAGCYYHL